MNDNNDYAYHQKFYDSFMSWVLWSTIAVVVLLILMAIFLV